MLPQHQVNITKLITVFFFNFNFSKEQCVLPEDDLMIETCGSVLM